MQCLKFNLFFTGFCTFWLVAQLGFTRYTSFVSCAKFSHCSRLGFRSRRFFSQNKLFEEISLRLFCNGLLLLLNSVSRLILLLSSVSRLINARWDVSCRGATSQQASATTYTRSAQRGHSSSLTSASQQITFKASLLGSNVLRDATANFFDILAGNFFETSYNACTDAATSKFFTSQNFFQCFTAGKVTVGQDGQTITRHTRSPRLVDCLGSGLLWRHACTCEFLKNLVVRASTYVCTLHDCASLDRRCRTSFNSLLGRQALSSFFRCTTRSGCAHHAPLGNVASAAASQNHWYELRYLLSKERCKQSWVGDCFSESGLERSKLAFFLCLLNPCVASCFTGLQTRRLHLFTVFGDVFSKTQCASLREVSCS